MFLRLGIFNNFALQVYSSLEYIMLNVQVLLPVQCHGIQTEVVAGDSRHRDVQVDLQFVVPGSVHKELLVDLQCHVGIEFQYD